MMSCFILLAFDRHVVASACKESRQSDCDRVLHLCKAQHRKGGLLMPFSNLIAWAGGCRWADGVVSIYGLR